jgi:predicted nuclease of predicted toxin-antitoxin system
MRSEIQARSNLGVRGKQLLTDSGHDVSTVQDQALCGADDEIVIDVCRREERCLVTMDLDFANPLAYDPAYDTIRLLITSTGERTNLTGKQWIVEPHRIREYAPDQP